jgi:hypothetical protein
VKSGLSCGASKLSSLGRFGVSTIQSGASLACKTVRCASRVFSNSAFFALNGITRHPKISIALGVLAGAVSVAVVAKKRFNVCVFEKLSGFCPFTTKKADKAAEADKTEEAPIAAEADHGEEKCEMADAPALEEVAPKDVEDSPRSSRSPSPSSASSDVIVEE